MSADQPGKQSVSALQCDGSSGARDEAKVLLELAPEPGIIYAHDGTILAINAPGLALMEADLPDQIVGKNLLSFMVPGQPASVLGSGRPVRSGERVYVDLEMLTAKGNRRRFEIMDVPLAKRAGEVERVLGFARDVTEQRRAERARDLLAAIVESSDDAIVSFDLGVRIVTWNQGAQKLFGFTPEEAVGRSIDIYTPPELRAHAKEILGHELVAARSQRLGVNRFEAQRQRKDGSLVDVSIVTSAIYDSGGKLVGLSAIMRDITERKRAERERALLAAIVESSDDAIIAKAPDYTISTWNSGAEKLYGYSAKEAVGKPVAMLIPADRLDELRGVIGRALRGENISHYETRRVRKDGALIEVSLTESPVRDAADRIVGVAAIERDIGERLRARELESRLASIVKSSAYAIFSLGAGFVVQSWNVGAERLFGYLAEEVIGLPCPIITPEIRARATDMYERVIESEGTIELEEQLARRDGTLIDVAIVASAIRDANRTVAAMGVIARDITDRKHSERALMQAQAELRSRLRQQAAVASLGQRALSKVEPVTLMNEAVVLAAETLGVDHCSIMELQPDGKSFVLRAGVGWKEGLIGHATADAGKDSLAGYTLLSGEAVIVQDLRTETRFRCVQWLHDHGAVSGLSVVVPAREKPYGMLGVFTRTSREFARYDVDFVQAVAHIVAETIERKRFEEELGRARDAALESARTKSAFLANMSHEIRTPLNVTIGFAEMLLETDLTKEQRDFAQSVHASGESLLGVINNILEFSSASSGNMTAEDIEFDVRTLMESVLDPLAEPAQHKRIELALSIGDDVPRLLRGDPRRLRQVLANLIGNAVKFTEHGEVLVKLTLETQTQTAAVVRFEVCDTGIGISEEAQCGLFQPFYQVDSSTTRKHRGSGLGLAIAAQLVERMGGKMGVTSRPGDGSTFWFTVTLEKSMTPAIPVEPERELQGLRVLIVDDNAINREIVHHQLDSWGIRSESAASAAEALAMMRKGAGADPYVIALVDSQMPEMERLKVANAVEADRSLSGTHVAMVSPINLSQLFGCLTSILHRDGGHPDEPVTT